MWVIKIENVFEIRQHMSIIEIVKLIRKNCTLLLRLFRLFLTHFIEMSQTNIKLRCILSVGVIKTFNEHEIQLWL